MFIVSLTYVAPLDRVDAVLADHVAYLEEQYAAGVFLASGRKIPRVGGVILAKADSRESLDAVLARDPFAQAKVATYEVTEMAVSKTAPGLETLIDA